MQKYYIYIGSNNETKKLEVSHSCQIISEYFDGFTAYEVIGYWKGQKEKTLKVEIVSDDMPAKVSKLCKQLAIELKQDAIMLEQVESNTAFIQAN